MYLQAEANLESAEITIQSLEQQIKGLNQSDNALRLQQQNENVIKDLKVRHQREILKYKEEIDKLQENLNSKVSFFFFFLCLLFYFSIFDRESIIYLDQIFEIEFLLQLQFFFSLNLLNTKTHVLVCVYVC